MGFFKWKVAYGSGRIEGKEEDHELSFVFINKNFQTGQHERDEQL